MCSGSEGLVFGTVGLNCFQVVMALHLQTTSSVGTPYIHKNVCVYFHEYFSVVTVWECAKCREFPLTFTYREKLILTLVLVFVWTYLVLCRNKKYILTPFPSSHPKLDLGAATYIHSRNSLFLLEATPVCSLLSLPIQSLYVYADQK